MDIEGLHARYGTESLPSYAQSRGVALRREGSSFHVKLNVVALLHLNSDVKPPFAEDASADIDNMGGLFVLRELLMGSPETQELIHSLSSCWIVFFEKALSQDGSIDLERLYRDFCRSLPDFSFTPAWVREYVLGISLYKARTALANEVNECFCSDNMWIAERLLNLLGQESELFKNNDRLFLFSDRFERTIDMKTIWVWSWSCYDYHRRVTYLIDPIERTLEFSKARTDQEYIKMQLQKELGLDIHSFWEGVGFPAAGKTTLALVFDFIAYLRGSEVISQEELHLAFAQERSEIKDRSVWWDKSLPAESTWFAGFMCEGEQMADQILRTFAKVKEIRSYIRKTLEQAIEQGGIQNTTPTTFHADTGVLASLVNYIINVAGEIPLEYLNPEAGILESLVLSESPMIPELVRNVMRGSVVTSGALMQISRLFIGDAIFLDMPTAIIRQRIRSDILEQRKAARMPFLEDYRLELLRWATYELVDIFSGSIHVVKGAHGLGNSRSILSSADSQSSSLVERLAKNRRGYEQTCLQYMPSAKLRSLSPQSPPLAVHSPLQNVWNTYWKLTFDEISGLYTRFFTWQPFYPVENLVDAIGDEVTRLRGIASIFTNQVSLINQAVPILLDESEMRIEEKRTQMAEIFSELIARLS